MIIFFKAAVFPSFYDLIVKKQIETANEINENLNVKKEIFNFKMRIYLNTPTYKS